MDKNVIHRNRLQSLNPKSPTCDLGRVELDLHLNTSCQHNDTEAIDSVSPVALDLPNTTVVAEHDVDLPS